jgi:hypothetical protein
MKISQILCLLLAVLSVSCTTSAIEDFVVGENFIRDRIGVVMIDTLTMKSSIVKYDSITSNSSGRLLVGSNYNSFSGYMNSKAYMEMMFDDDIKNTEFVFDSVNLILYYDTYYSGDTTISQTLNVYQLKEQMELGDNSYLYTTSHFAFGDVPLGSVNFKPEPKSHKQLNIRLSNKLGLRLAKMIKEDNDSLSIASLFKKVFKGFVLSGPQNQKAAAVGFRITDAALTTTESTSTSTSTETMPQIRLYYHLDPNPDDLYDLYYNFSFNTDGIYFNQISSDASNSLIDGTFDSRNERDTKLTNNDLFVQSGIQVFSKITIPYVDNLLWMGNSSAFVGATLKLFPIKGTYTSTEELPDTLYIFTADHKNKITAQIFMPGSTTKYSYAQLVVEKDVEEKVYYEVDIGNFIDTKLKSALETDRSLMIGYGSSSINMSVNHVVLGGINSGKYSPELNVYYYHN